MLIDGFTVLVQVVNFLILVLLLKRFLYGPVIRAMAAREQRIAQAMQQAQAAEGEAHRRAEALARERQDLAAAKELLLAEAGAEVREWRRQALKEVNREVEALRRSWRLRLSQGQEAFLGRLRARIAGQVMQISDKVLRELADDAVENRLVAVLTDRLGQEGDFSGAAAIEATVTVQCGFELVPEQADRLRRRILQVFPKTRAVRFESSAELGLGLRLTAGDRKVEWNLNHTLEALEKGVMAELAAAVRERP